MYSNKIKLIEANYQELDLGLLDHLASMVEYSSTLPYPILAIKYNNKFLVLDGLKRLADTKLNILIDEEKTIADYSEQIFLWLKINLQHRKLNELEKAVVVNKLLTFMNEKQLILKLNIFFDISKKAIEDYKQYINLPSNIQKYISQNSPSRNAIRFILTAPIEIKNGINSLLQNTQINSSILKQITEYATDLFLAEGYNYLESNEFKTIVTNSGIKVALEHLRKKRLPKLSGLRALIDREIKKVQTEILNISYDNTFENNGIKISADINTSDDAKKLKSDIENLSQKDNIKNLLNIYKNEK